MKAKGNLMLPSHSLFCSPLTNRPRTRLRDLFACFSIRKASRRLRLCESLSLGEKRLIAVIQYESQKFLVGGGPQSVNLLAHLNEEGDFPNGATESHKS
jgi:flagellar biogenesis protein FliO